MTRIFKTWPAFRWDNLTFTFIHFSWHFYPKCQRSHASGATRD